MGKRRKINPGVSNSVHISPSNGRTSVSWRRGSRHAERERERERKSMNTGVGERMVIVGGRMRKRALSMAAKRVSK